MVADLRAQLHFAAPSDPRLTMPDRKQKGRLLTGADNPELLLLEAAKQAMQLSPAAGDAVLKELKAVAGARGGVVGGL